jgi:short-subunit dehydrogenase
MKVLIIGATSAIAEATARLYAVRGDRLYLVARNAAKLEAISADLQVRGASWVGSMVMDACDTDRHAEMLNAAVDGLDGLDIVLIAHGTLPDQELAQQTYPATLQVLEDNFLSVVSMLTGMANFLEEQGHGSIAVISSVAGDRGRQSNYAYGTAKGGLSVFLQGLRNRLAHAGVNVLTVKPGFVNTPMTAHLNGSGPLWAEPADIAEGIVQGIEKERSVIYLPGFWRLIMMIICAIPEIVFKRLKL